MNLATPIRSLPPISPERLLALRGADGDATATAQLLRILSPRIARIVKAVLGPAHPDVDDVHQIALVGLVQALPAYRGDCEVLGYARVIAVRASIAARKKRRAEPKAGADGENDELADPRPDPRASLESGERKHLLRGLLAELPEEQAETLAMRVVLGCSLDEIAEETGVPLNTVRSRIRLAKERLRARIESDPRLGDAF